MKAKRNATRGQPAAGDLAFTAVCSSVRADPISRFCNFAHGRHPNWRASVAALLRRFQLDEDILIKLAAEVAQFVLFAGVAPDHAADFVVGDDRMTLHVLKLDLPPVTLMMT
jgi:hypothetical protein